MAKANPSQVYQLKITLAGIKPTAWRPVEPEALDAMKATKEMSKAT
jgi:hypothetical protein